jgi:hypothetical protein
MERAVTVFNQHFASYLDQATERVLAAASAVHASVPRDVLRGAISRAFSMVKQDLELGTTSAYPEYLSQARVILVEISPEIAITFAKAGADLGGIIVLGDLTSGVEHALRLRGRAITPI